VTALTPDQELDVRSHQAVLAHQLDAGVNAVFVAGTTGEGAFMTPPLAAKLTEVTIDFIAGQVPVLVGALAPGTAGAIESARAAEAAGADAAVVTTPFYGPVSDAELAAHFRSAAKAVDLPLLAYSIPSMTHLPIPVSVLEELFADSVVAGFKDSGNDWSTLAAAIELGKRHGKNVYAGYEPFAARAMEQGAAGLVASFCNVDPKLVVSLYQSGSARSAESGSEADLAQSRLVDLIDRFASLTSGDIGPTSALVGGIKAALVMMGQLRSGSVLPPLVALPERLTPIIRAHLQATGISA
jgi:4-hydroxy-tetrahydrodipicolinate synthase